MTHNLHKQNHKFYHSFNLGESSKPIGNLINKSGSNDYSTVNWSYKCLLCSDLNHFPSDTKVFIPVQETKLRTIFAFNSSITTLMRSISLSFHNSNLIIFYSASLRNLFRSFVFVLLLVHCGAKSY